MSNVSQWETSAPNNDAAPPDGAPEGMAANTVNDTMREMMAATARWYQDINGSLVTGGAGNAYTLTTNNNNSSFTDLPLVVFVANRANSGAATLNVDGLGAKSLRFGGVALAAGVIQEDVAYIAIYNAEDDAFDIVGYPTKDASEITTGELDDDRLSSNVPLKDAPNVFTDRATFTSTSSGSAGSSIVLQSASPGITLVEEDAGEDEKAWAIARPINGRLVFYTATDAQIGSVGNTFMAVERSGTTVTEVELNADALDFNGDADISGTLTVGGTISGNGSGLTNLNASNLSSGTVPDARLSSNVPLLNAANTFTDRATFTSTSSGSAGSSIVLQSASPGITLVEEDAGEDEKAWAIARPINGRLVFYTATDAQIGSVGNTFMAVERSGTTVTEVELNADVLDFNGNADISGTLEVGGAVRAGTAATSTSSTLAAGQIHHRSANTTIPSMNAGQWVAVQNTGTSSITLSEGSGVTLELGGTTTTGNRTLLAKGFAFIYFRANGVGVVHGSGVT